MYPMRNLKTCFILFICGFAILSSQARTMRNLYSGNWYDGSIWEGGHAPSTLDVVTITGGTNVFVFGGYADCDSLTVNGFFDVGQTNFTVGGRDLYTDYRAIRNTTCLINGGLRINGNVDTQFKVYGNLKFNQGSTFEMSAGKIMIDGAAFTPELSVPAEKALLEVSNLASFNQSGGLIILFNPHYFQGGLSIKGAKDFYAVSFGNNNSLPIFAARTTNDFLLSETETPTMHNIYLKYLPNPNHQNKVILFDKMSFETLQSDIGVLSVKSGGLKFSNNVLLSENVPIEGDIELNGVGEQKFGTSNGSNNLVHLKGNLIINNPDKIQCDANIEVENGTVKFMRGKMDLKNFTLTLNSPPTGTNENSYFITKNNYTANGTLVIKNLQGATTFPVGTDNDYLPATLTAWGSDFSVSARPLVNYPYNGSFPINAQWDIKRVAGYSNADIRLQWPKAVENYNFSLNRQGAHVYRGEWGNWYSLPNWTWGITNVNNAVFSQKAQNIDYFTTFTVLTETVIPVELTHFTAQKQADNAVLLTWETATELDNVGFEVEKSADGRLFATIGFVKGAGHSTALKVYNFTDNAFIQTAYYRLKQMDNNEKTTYSRVVSVQKDKGKWALNVYPNLVTQQSEITLEVLNATDEAREFTVFDANGRQVFYRNQGVKAAVSVQIPVADLAKGMYIIKARIGQEVKVVRFVKTGD